MKENKTKISEIALETNAFKDEEPKIEEPKVEEEKKGRC